MILTTSQIFYSLLPLLGVIVGGAATYLTQSKILNSQLDRDIEKEKETQNIERLTVYSEILKIEGNYIMLESGYGHFKLNIEVYSNNIRPVLYSKFHLLDQDIADNVRQMDLIIAEANFNEELEAFQEQSLVDIYNKLILEIENHLNFYRSS